MLESCHDLRQTASIAIRQKKHQPTDADWGCDVTIAIAAIANPDDVIVCVSDRMISFGDNFPAEDNALVKAIYLHDQWTCAFATNRLPFVLPIIQATRARFNDPLKLSWDGREAAEAMASAYSELLQGEFAELYLKRYGYKTVDEFRQNGRADLGEHFTELCIELDRFDLHTSFLFFGHDKQKHARIFEVDSPGHVIDRNALKFAVIGSGHDMAMASLRWPPPMTFFLEDTIYRLLEAKFAAETATGVGKMTTVALRNREGRITLLPRSDIDEIREIWKRCVANVPSPSKAIELLENSKAVKDVAGER